MQAAHPPFAAGFNEAVERACAENDTDIGLYGNGIPLPSRDGAPAVCYVLPLGKSESRRALGPGLAALFISTEKAALPPTLEALSALTGLTSQESRIALDDRRRRQPEGRRGTARHQPQHDPQPHHPYFSEDRHKRPAGGSQARRRSQPAGAAGLSITIYFGGSPEQVISGGASG